MHRESGATDLSGAYARRYVSRRAQTAEESRWQGMTGNWFGVGPQMFARSWQTGSSEVEGGSLVVVGGRVELLVGQNRQVLRDGVTEQGSEDADVIAASVAHPDDCLWS